MKKTIPEIIWAGAGLGAAIWLLLTHPFGASLARDLVGIGAFFFLCFVIWRRSSFRGLRGVVFLVTSGTILAYVFLSGMLEIPVTPVPHMRTFLKLVFSLSFVVILWLSVSGAGFSTILAATLFFGSNFLLSWHFQGITLRAIPLAIFVLCASGLFLWNRQGRLHLFGRDALPAALFFLVGVSAFCSPIRGGGLHVAFAALVAIALYALARLADEDELREQLNMLRLAFALVVLVLGAYCVVSFWRIGSVLERESLAGYNANGVGAHAAILMPLLVAAAAVAAGWRRALWSLCGLVALLVIMATSSRTALLASITGSFVVLAGAFYLHARKGAVSPLFHRLKLGLPLGAMLAALIVLGGTLVFQVKGWESVAARKSIWAMYVHNAWVHGGLFGFGPEAYGMNFVWAPGFLSNGDREAVEGFARVFGSNTHAHNLLIQLWFDLGPFGPLLLFGIAFVLVRRTIHDPLLRQHLGALGSLCALAVHSLMEFSLGDTATLLPVAYLLGVLFRPMPNEVPLLELSGTRARNLWLTFSLPALVVGIYVAYNFVVLQQLRRAIGSSLSSGQAGRLLVRADLSPAHRHSIRRLDGAFLPLAYDWRIEALRGEALLALSGKEPTLAARAEHRFRACLELNHFSGACCAGLADSFERQGRPAEAAHWRAQARRLDPWGLGL